MSIWFKYEQNELRKKMEISANNQLQHSNDIVKHKETLNHIKNIITTVGLEMNELNSNQKKSAELFAQFSET